MSILDITFERHKQLLFESLTDNWEDKVDWTPIISLYGSQNVSSRTLDEIINSPESAPVSSQTPLIKIKVDSRPTEQFWTMFDELPPKIQSIAKESYKLFNVDPYNVRLRFHRLKQGHETYAVNVGGSYRAIGIRQSSSPTVLSIKWIWIGYHGNYDDQLDKIRKQRTK